MFTGPSGRRAAEALVKLPFHRRPTAVFAANDRMAIGMLQRLTELGVRVPADVSIIGYDDIEPCQFVLPKLTTVRQPMEEMGRVATELLLRRLKGEEFPPQNVVLQTEIVVRDSCVSIPRQGSN